MGSYFRSIATPVAKEDCLASLRAAWIAHFGAPPKDDAVRLMTSQWGLESTWGKAGYCYNLGNIRASSECDYMYISGNEIVNGELVWFSGDKPSDLAKFRAFRSLAESAEYYVGFMSRRAPIMAVLNGSCDPNAYVAALKEVGYFTDSLDHYTKNFLAVHKSIAGLPVPTGEAAAYPEMKPDPAGDPSLAAKKEPENPAPAPAPAAAPPPPVPDKGSAEPRMIAVAEFTVTARPVGSTEPLPRFRVGSSSKDAETSTNAETSTGAASEVAITKAAQETKAPPSEPAQANDRARRGAREIFADLPEVLGQEPPEEREARIWAEIEGKNYPSFAASFVPLEVTDSKGRRATFQVATDCFAIGTDDDWLHAQLSGYYAQKTAEMFDAFLPTNGLVLAMYKKAAIKLVAHPFDCQSSYGGKWQRSTFAMRLHDDVIQGKVACKPGEKVPEANGRLNPNLGAHAGVCALPSGRHPEVLVAGHLKEVILSHEDLTKRLAFWGFFTSEGRPIQRGFGCPHGPGFADYSHGFRLVGRPVDIDGKKLDYEEVVTNPEYASLVFAEGGQPCRPPRYPPPPSKFYMGH